MKPRPQLPRLIRGVQLNVEEPYPFYSRGLAAGDAAGFAESVAANTLIVFARDAWGRSLYESRLYPRHPGSLRLEELDAEAAARGLRLIVMTSHTSNPYLAERHPDWVQRGPDGSPRTLDHNPRRWRGKPLWPLVCPNSPALRLYLAPEAGEALDAAPHASGVLLDSFRYMPDPGRACFCRWCRERFRRETGLELPAGRCGACEAEYREAWEWRLRVHVEAVEAIAREVHSRGGLLLYNSHPGGWSGRGTRIVYMARGLVDAVFAELSEADEAGPLFTPFMVKLSLAASGWKPVLATRNAFHHLRTLHSAPQSLLARGVWEIVAAGGHPVVTVFASTLREDPRFAQALARVYRALDRLEELLVDRRPLYEAVILYSPASHDWHRHEAPWAYMGELMGLAEGLTLLGLPWGVAVAEDLASTGDELPGRPGLVAAADTGVAGDELLARLARLPREGVAVLSTGLTGEKRPDHTERSSSPLLERLGLTLLGRVEYGAAFLEASAGWSGDGLPRRIPLGAPDPVFEERRWDPYLGEALAARPEPGSEHRVTLWLRLPASSRGHEYTAGRSHPPPGPAPGLAAAACGDGLCVHTYRLGLHIAVLGHPDYLAVLEKSLETLLPQPRLRVHGPVEAEAWTQGETLLVHLLPLCWWGAASPAEATPGEAAQVLPPWRLRLPPEHGCTAEAIVEARLWSPGTRLEASLYTWDGREKRLPPLQASGRGEVVARVRVEWPHALLRLAPKA